MKACVPVSRASKIADTAIDHVDHSRYQRDRSAVRRADLKYLRCMEMLVLLSLRRIKRTRGGGRLEESLRLVSVARWRASCCWTAQTASSRVELGCGEVEVRSRRSCFDQCQRSRCCCLMGRCRRIERSAAVVVVIEELKVEPRRESRVYDEVRIIGRVADDDVVDNFVLT